VWWKLSLCDFVEEKPITTSCEEGTRPIRYPIDDEEGTRPKGTNTDRSILETPRAGIKFWAWQLVSSPSDSGECSRFPSGGVCAKKPRAA